MQSQPDKLLDKIGAIVFSKTRHALYTARTRIVLLTAACFFLLTPYTTDGPAAQPQPLPVTNDEVSSTAAGSSTLIQPLGQIVRETTIQQDLRGAENALAQAMVALALAQVPISRFKSEAPDDNAIQEVPKAVEQHVDTAMNAYQNAVLASTGEAVQALTTVVHIAAIAAQVWVNIAVARLQMHLLHQRQRRVVTALSLTGATQQDGTIALAAQALAHARTHVEAIQKQSQAAMDAARQVESASSDEESREALASLSALKLTAQARAVATGAQVMLVSAYATGDPAAIAAAYQVIRVAQGLLMTTTRQTQQTAPPLVPSRNWRQSVKHDTQMTIVRVRMATSVVQVALAQAYNAGLEPPKSAKAAAAVVAKQVRTVLQAARAMDQARTEDSARVQVEAAQAVALAAAVTARIADVYIRLEMIKKRQDAALATAARLAALEQLRTAVARAQNAISSANIASKAAQQAQTASSGTVTPDTMTAVRQAKEQTAAQAYLGIAWAQSALYWTQAAWSWAHNMEEVAIASEAGAVAAESAATMIEATVGVSVGNVSQTDTGLNSVSTFAITVSPSPLSDSTPSLGVKESDSSTSPSSAFDDAQVLLDTPGPPVGVASPSR